MQKLVLENSDHGGADVVLEVAGVPSTFQLAWQCARPNAIVTIVAYMMNHKFTTSRHVWKT